MPLTVVLGSIVFSGGADADGDRFTVASLDGWEAPEVTLDTERAGRRGLVVARQRLDGRPVTIAGAGYQHGGVLGVDRTWRIQKKLVQAVDGLAEGAGTLLVNEPAEGRGAVQADVVLAARPRIKRTGPYSVEFEIDLLASDPRVYSQSLTETTIASTSATVTNAGTFRTPVRAVLLASATGPWVQNNTDGNKRVTVSGAQAAGLVIDFEKRKVTAADGSNLYGSVLAGSKFFDLLVGPNTIQTSGTWRVEHRDAWL